MAPLTGNPAQPLPARGSGQVQQTTGGRQAPVRKATGQAQQTTAGGRAPPVRKATGQAQQTSGQAQQTSGQAQQTSGQAPPASPNRTPNRKATLNANGQGSSSQGGTNNNTKKPKVTALYINDFTDVDNEHVACVWGYAMNALAPSVDLTALYVGEPRSVSIETELVGPSFLKVLSVTRSLFERGGVVSSLIIKEKEKANGETPEIWRGLEQAYKKHWTNMTTTLVRGDLTGSDITNILAIPGVVNEVLKNLFAKEKAAEAKAKEKGTWDPNAPDGPILAMAKRWAGAPATAKSELKELLEWCHRPSFSGSKSQDDYDSLLCAELTMRDYIQSMKSFGCYKDIQYFIDGEHLDQIKTVLNHKAHHPEYLVCRGKDTTKKFSDILKDTTKSRPQKAAELRTILEDARKERIEENNQTIRVLKKKGDTDNHIVKHLLTADKVLIFGGSSLSIMSNVVGACKKYPGLASKITFVGQGGTFDPSINLTANPYNFDLTRSAAEQVLRFQATSPEPFKQFILVTTEVGKQVQFTVNELADLRPSTAPGVMDCYYMGLRTGAFGIDANRLGPQRVIMQFGELVERKEGVKTPPTPWPTALNMVFKNQTVRSPDLCALFAVFSSTFKAHYYDGASSFPPGIIIGPKGSIFTFMKEAPALPNESWLPIEQNRIQVWMPHLKPKMDTCTGLRSLVDECVGKIARFGTAKSL